MKKRFRKWFGKRLDNNGLTNQPLNDENKMVVENEIAVEESALVRFNAKTEMNLGGFLCSAADAERLGTLKLLKIVTDELRFISDEQEILSYNMLSDVLDNPKNIRETTIINYGVTLILTYLPAYARMSETLTITINYEGETSNTFYFRVTYTEQPNRINNTYDIGDNRANRPYSSSTMIAFDKVSIDDKMAEFRFMVNDAIDKIESGREDEITDMQRYALDCYNLNIDKNAYFGNKLFDDGRFVEALPYLRSAHRKMQSKFLKFSKEERDMFNEILYMIGYCYCELHQYEKAYFYLSLAESDDKKTYVKYTTELLNSLANSGDIRALIDTADYLKDTERLIENEDVTDEGKEILRGFRTFLMRRCAYNCVEHGYYDDAENYLKQLLDDPESEGFALRELDYIKDMRENNGKA